MFVRWKRREYVSRKRRGRKVPRDKPFFWKKVKGREWVHVRTGRFLLSAVLVRSERRDGKPRQKIVASLGGIPEQDLESVMRRYHFREGASRRLDALGLDPESRRNAEAALEARVPRPAVEQVAQARKEAEAILGPGWV